MKKKEFYVAGFPSDIGDYPILEILSIATTSIYYRGL